MNPEKSYLSSNQCCCTLSALFLTSPSLLIFWLLSPLREMGLRPPKNSCGPPVCPCRILYCLHLLEALGQCLLRHVVFGPVHQGWLRPPHMCILDHTECPLLGTLYPRDEGPHSWLEPSLSISDYCPSIIGYSCETLLFSFAPLSSSMFFSCHVSPSHWGLATEDTDSRAVAIAPDVPRSFTDFPVRGKEPPRAMVAAAQARSPGTVCGGDS